MIDLKTLQETLGQIEEEKGIPREKILDAIQSALAAAYKRDYGTRGQVIRSHFNPETGDLEFFQVKTVVDDTLVKPALTKEQLADPEFEEEVNEEDERVRFNIEHHMYVADAQMMRAGAKLEDEIIFPLDNPLLEEDSEFGRVAALTAKQVIIGKIRDAEKEIKLARYEKLIGTVLTGTIQKIVAGRLFIELAPRTIGVVEKEEQASGEWYRPGDAVKVYLMSAEAGPRGVLLNLSRKSPEIIRELFKIESPEIATGTVEIKAVSREAGDRTKMAVYSNDPDVDPIGACVGQRGSRINAVTNNLGNEKIDIIVWSEDPLLYVANALAPAQVIDIEGDLDKKEAKIIVAEDQLSLAIGKSGQNARLAARLTGWKIDISGTAEHPDLEVETENTPDEKTDEGFGSLKDLKGAIKNAQDAENTDDADSKESTE
ncbi:MAG: transcription termination factor NusA [Candidatus Pacebacteria bacterium]|nr:transcription termination factor NusA [Candidatus Paceibacterota bacterium]